MESEERRDFPISAGILFGLGLGGFFDGIVLHQLLQWHHMLTSAGYPPDTVANLRVNTLWDGIFPRQYLYLCSLWFSHSLEAGAPDTYQMVEQIVDRQFVDGIWHLQRGGRKR